VATTPKLVLQITRLVDRSEYKRRQMAPGVRISKKAFGRDRRMPITNAFRQETLWTPTNREIAEHLLACYDTIYIVLGESAPTLSHDAYVVAPTRAPRLRRPALEFAKSTLERRRLRRFRSSI